MSPDVHNSPDIDSDHHPLAQPISISIPESPSASTTVSSDTIDTAPSSLSSEILGGSSVYTPSRSSELLPDESATTATNTKTSESSNQLTGPFTRHKRFFFEDGNITFLVDGILYRVHRYFFCRDSKTFMTRLSRLPASPFLPVISLENVKSKDLDAFLSVLYPPDFNALEEHSFEELSSILNLSTRWGFTSIRDMAIRHMEPPTPHERLILGRKYGVDEWVPRALQELCERPQLLTLDEARLMDVEDVILVGSVREKVRSNALRVNSAGIRDCIEALRRGESWTMPLVASSTPSSPSSTLGFGPPFPVTFGAASTNAITSSGFGSFGGFGGL